MYKWLLISLGLVISSSGGLRAQTSYADQVRKYVEEHKALAMEEQRRSGIPAAITLGQGILETGAGSSRLMQQANNHFGIKCKRGWDGPTFAHTDDAPNECFRKYDNALQSYKDHSDFLKHSPRYAPLFTLSATDYAAWAHGLKRCGYATNPRYAQQLIRIIEEYRLQDYTYAVLEAPESSDMGLAATIPDAELSQEEAVAPAAEPELLASTDASPRYTYQPSAEPVVAEAPATPATPDAGGVIRMHGLRAIHARKGDVLLEHAIRHNIRYARLLEWNELPDAPLAEDMVIYLEKKNVKGSRPTHIVQPGESLQSIAQAEGILLRQLKAFNQIDIHEAPAPGTVLKLQEYAAVKPRTVSARQVTRPAAPEAPAAAPAIHTRPAAENMIATNRGQRAAQGQMPEAATETPIPPPTAVPAPQPSAPAQVAPATPHQPIETLVAVEEEMAAEADEETPETEVVAAPEPAPVPVPEAPAAPAEPMSEFDRLKARLDRVVYAEERAPAPVPAVPANRQAPPPARPGVPAPAAGNSGGTFYTVKKGDTAYGIARRHNISVSQLMEWNQLQNFQSIRTGQRLKISR
jgi:LysM repeat protein